MRNTECEALLKIANRLYQQEDFRRVRTLLEIMSEVYPREVQVWTTLAMVANNDSEKTEYLARASQLQRQAQPS
jgi:hypothetical protein